MVAAKLANLSHGGDRRQEQAPDLGLAPAIPAPISTEKAATLLNVGRGTVEAARVVTRQATPDLAAKVESGKVSVTVRRKQVYEVLHPETRHGAIGNGREKARKDCDSTPPDRFTADTAARTGRSERAVQLDAARGEAVAEEALDAVRGTAADTGRGGR